MARLGMDVERVESAARSLQARASDIDGLINRIDAVVSRLPGVWEGPEAQRFVREWWPAQRRVLLAASSHVAGLGQSALNNASEQRTASSSGSGGGGGSDSSGSVLRLGGSGALGGPAVHSAADRYDLTRSTSDDSDGVRIQGVRGDDGELRYVVYLNGTVPDRLDDRGVLENVAVLGVNTSTYNHLVEKMISQIQPPGSEVMIVGYSQGGIHAQLLAASGNFKVTDVITYGSPNCRLVGPASDYNIVRIQDVDDNIPKLDPDVVATAWQSILGDDKGAVEHLLARNNNPHDQTYDTDTSAASELGIGTHGSLKTYEEGGSQYEIQAQSTPEGRMALESQSRYTGQLMSDSDAQKAPDAPVWDPGSNTWTGKY